MNINWIPHVSLTISTLNTTNDWKEKTAPFTTELCVYLAKDWEIEGAYSAGVGGTVGSSAAAHHRGEPADPQQCIWAAAMPGTQPDTLTLRALKKEGGVCYFTSALNLAQNVTYGQC